MIAFESASRLPANVGIIPGMPALVAGHQGIAFDGWYPFMIRASYSVLNCKAKQTKPTGAR